jgi:hypothetical protein
LKLVMGHPLDHGTDLRVTNTAIVLRARSGGGRQ